MWIQIVSLYIKKTDDIYKEDVETKFHTSSHELDRTWPKGKNKQVTRLTEDELGNTYRYIIDDVSEDEEAKGTKKIVIKKTYKNCYKNCLEATQLEEKNELIVSSLERDFKEFIKNVKGIMFLMKKLIRLL